ncbi:hypothetical protein [Staphylococcus auricularis]|uniref:Phage protein n=1 Tax=Staphylococcus auricularis TaxID=29379 RepID=A0ABX5IDC0_9STAP|nr:hypothetical protein [Staphylococcus auricularis]MCE5039321.1 hypothetical protein [Staphylococcus auricularis]MEB6570399.1 hypothetical protein [Staphylococcus auricularis]PTH16825.1 hypothetical protein BU607_07960 [Staphylococcus auricularis]PTH25055.1 hypothetical protein BU608_08925 [Staphylococcus auricularis]
MKWLIWIINLLNYVILAGLIVINYNQLSYIGLHIVEYFWIACSLLTVISIIAYFLTKKESFLASMLLNLFNIIVIGTLLLVFLF